MNRIVVRSVWYCLILATSIWIASLAADAANGQLTRSVSDPRSPERRAVAFLAQEVPRWSQQNHCYSCHNNGDAARALYAARSLGYPVPADSLRDTTAWLTTPDRWKDNKGDPEFSDQQLADIQFAFALQSARESGGIEHDRAAIRGAAALVISHQSADGCWQIDASGAIGSPATYGTYLATVAATRVLRGVNDETAKQAQARAERWLIAQRPVTVLDAAALLFWLDPEATGQITALRRHCQQVIRRGADPEGGWGPYVTSRREPFDTALVLLALSKPRPRAEWLTLVTEGRKFLVHSQLPDGSWTETTRPANAVSYAQRLATSGWATLALLATVQQGQDTQ